MKTKVIVAGDVRGNLEPVLARVAKLNAAGKGPFGVVFCVGELAARGDAARVEESRDAVGDGAQEKTEEGGRGDAPSFADYLSGRASLPFKLYFVLSGSPHDAQLAAALKLGRSRQEVAPGVVFLGQAAVGTIECGLRVAALSGVYDRGTYRPPSSSSEDANVAAGDGAAFQRHYCKADIDEMLGSPEAVKPVDLFLSCEWGEGFDTLIPSSEVRPLPHALSPVVADLARRLMPRHHLATGKFCLNCRRTSTRTRRMARRCTPPVLWPSDPCQSPSVMPSTEPRTVRKPWPRRRPNRPSGCMR